MLTFTADEISKKSKVLGVARLLDYILRITGGMTPGQKKAAEVEVEYHCETYSTRRRIKAKSMRIEQTEHGPLILIISEQETVQ
jgi:hypothetical protein